MKKKVLVLAAEVNDVPADHWAYKAVTQLSKVGIVDDFDDKSFQGNKFMTRYEMAQVVEKAMDNSSKANAKQKTLIDKLASEFALELKKIDTRVTSVETRVTKLEDASKSALKVTMDSLMAYGFDNPPDGKRKATGTEQFLWRPILYMKGDLNDQLKFQLRLRPTLSGPGMNSSAGNSGAKLDNMFSMTLYTKI